MTEFMKRVLPTLKTKTYFPKKKESNETPLQKISRLIQEKHKIKKQGVDHTLNPDYPYETGISG